MGDFWHRLQQRRPGDCIHGGGASKPSEYCGRKRSTRGPFMLPPNPKIERQAVCDAPIVLNKNGPILGLRGVVRVVVEAAAGGQAKQERGQVLAHRRGGGIVQRPAHPVRAECERSVGVAMRVLALAVQPQIGSQLGRVVAVDLHHVREDLVSVVRRVVGAVLAEVLIVAEGEQRHGGEFRIGFQVSREIPVWRDRSHRPVHNFSFLPAGAFACSTETSEKITVSDASALCEQTASPTKIGSANWIWVCPSSFSSAPSFAIDTVTDEPWRPTSA